MGDMSPLSKGIDQDIPEKDIPKVESLDFKDIQSELENLKGSIDKEGPIDNEDIDQQLEIFTDPPVFFPDIESNDGSYWEYTETDYEKLVEDNEEGEVILQLKLPKEDKLVEFVFQNKQGSNLSELKIPGRQLRSSIQTVDGEEYVLTLSNVAGVIYGDVRNVEKRPDDTIIDDKKDKIDDKEELDFEGKEILEHSGVTWLPQVKEGDIDELPTLQEDGEEIKLYGYKESVQWLGDGKLTDIQKEVLETISIDHDEDNGWSHDNPDEFSLWRPKIVGITGIELPSIIQRIDFSQTDKFTKNADGWEYKTEDQNGNDLVLQIMTEEKALTEDFQANIFSVGIKKIDEEILKPVDLLDEFNLDLSDFEDIGKDLKDKFVKLETVQQLRDWLQEVYDDMSDAVDNYVYYTQTLKNKNQVEIGGKKAKYLDNQVYPMQGREGSEVEEFFFKQNWQDKITLDLDLPGFGPSQEILEFDLEDTNKSVIEGTKTIKGVRKVNDIPIHGEWKYRFYVEKMKRGDGKTANVLRGSILPPKDYIEFYNKKVEDKETVETLKTMGYPLPKENNNVISGFGMRNGKMHNGVDIDVINNPKAKIPVYSVFSGRVVIVRKYNDANTNGTYGTYIVVQHEVDGKKFRTVYGHVDDDSLQVKEGDKVSAGDMLTNVEQNKAEQGRSSGTHLHFELRKKDKKYKEGKNHIHNGWKPIDPEEFLKNK